MFQGDKGDKGERGLTTTLNGDQFPTGIIEGPPGPPGPPGNLMIAFKQITEKKKKLVYLCCLFISMLVSQFIILIHIIQKN